MNKIKIKHVAQMLNKSEQCVRIGLQRDKFPFGTAYKTHDSNTKYTYSIYPGKLEEYIGKERFNQVMNSN
ncbi:hypothetical protein [Peptostreptococcus equinus]|uniref:Uncharacterized protein n=1 Tax=Peptostreptococcus equinus TaxID=3003601 RepID=A0ABY7JN23_9FIRM|nr:hypothetical protein [Peptostreptococcus sp. CBA3647]WAW14769.1 hypothetical protein O0R46_09315 [Peptostreptococcus sp. CBA3647]